MSSTIQEKSARVMLAAWNMDMFARLSLLEGRAGVAPGSWLRRRERGFADALEHFSGKLEPRWTTTHDTGLYSTAIRTARSTLSGASGLDADDLVQTLVSESGRPGGKPAHRLFYSVGDGLRKAHRDFDHVSPVDRLVRGSVTNYVKNAARDVYKTWQQKHVTHGEIPVSRAPTSQGLSDDQKEKLLLLALQTPGQVRRKVYDVIEHEARQVWPRAADVVMVFLEKIADPRYRSVQEMKRIMGKRWNVNQWFTQAFNKARREVMNETGISSQALTNLLGSRGKNVFRFMRERVGRNPKIQSIIRDLAAEIELLEPGQFHMGAQDDKEAELTLRQMPKPYFHEMQDWLHGLMAPAMHHGPAEHPTSMDVPMDVEQGELPEEVLAVGPSDPPATAPMDVPMDVETGEMNGEPGPMEIPMDIETGEISEKESAPLLPEQTPEQPWHSVQDWLEKDEYMDWATQSGNPGVHSRGPIVLRVASAWIRRQADEQWKSLKEQDDFKVWLQGRKFRHAETNNMDLYPSLPDAQQKQIREWWRANKCKECKGKGKTQLFSSEETCTVCGGAGTGTAAIGENAGKMMDTLRDMVKNPNVAGGLPGSAHQKWQEVLETMKGNNPLHVMRSVRKFMYDIPHEEKHNAAGTYHQLYRTMKDAFKEYQSGLDKARGDRVRDPIDVQDGERYIIKDPRSSSSTSKFRDITIKDVEEKDGVKTFHYYDATGDDGHFTSEHMTGKQISVSRPKTKKQAATARVGTAWLEQRLAGVR